MRLNLKKRSSRGGGGYSSNFSRHFAKPFHISCVTLPQGNRAVEVGVDAKTKENLNLWVRVCGISWPSEDLRYLERRFGEEARRKEAEEKGICLAEDLLQYDSEKKESSRLHS